MAEDTTKLIIEVSTLLKGLDRTLAGLAKVESQLKRVAAVRVTGQTAATGFDRASAAARRLEIQQGRLNVQAQRLANQQERVNQTTARLAVGQQRLAQAQDRVARSAEQQADAHVKAFRNLEAAARKAQRETVVAFGKTNEQLISIGNAARSIGQGLTSLGATLTATLTVPLTALGIASVNAAVQLDSLKRGLAAIVGSGAEAATQLARLTQIAKLPGIGFEEAIQGSIRLQAVGFSALEAEKALTQFSNAVALTGGGRDELARITVQLGQLAAKGKVLSQDLRPIIEAAPAVGRALKQAFGTVNADDIADMTTSSREFLDVLVSELERLPRAAGGAKNSFENFRDTVFRAAAAIGEALLPALTKLAEIVGPIITALADGFSKLPIPLQAAVVGMGALLAVAGPVVFIVGALILAVGRLAVGVAQFNAQLPASAAGLFGMATGANAASGALTTLRVAAIGTTAALVGLVGLIAQVVAAYVIYNKLVEQSADVTDEQLTATKEQVDQLKDQLGFVDRLKGGVARTADEQRRLLEIYRGLNIDAQERVGGIKNETVEIAKLRAEVERLLQLRLQEREQQTATIVGSLADTLKLIEARKRESDAITDQITKNTALIAVQRANTEQNDNSILRINELIAANKDLLAAQDGLSKENQKSIETAKNYARQLIALGATSTDQIRNFLALRQAMGLFEGSIDDAVPVLKVFIDGLNATTDAARRLKGELSGIDALLKQSSDSSEQLQKDRQELIRRNAIIAREFGRDFNEARKAMEFFIAKQPELQAAIRREAEIAGKSVEEVVSDALGGPRTGRGESALRNAQQQLARAIEDVALASADRQKTIEQNKLDDMLAANEISFARQLRSYRAYLEARALFTTDALDKEIGQELERAVAARQAQKRLLAAAQQPVPAAERTRRQAQAAEAEERAVKAETKALELTAKRNDIEVALQRTLAETAIQQEKDIAQLAIQFGELQGRVEDAFKAETLEEFRETLQQLSRDQQFLNEQLVIATRNKNADRIAEINAAKARNQRQIELIESVVAVKNAEGELLAAEQLITNAKEKQAQLERDLQFQVEFRGLAEEEAIRQRLEGEAKVADSLRLARDVVTDTIKRLQELGLTPPKALTDFVRETTAAIQGLGELPFVEQFRLAQKEFDRLNDLRVRKIQEVERAVAHRDISELQGRIAIRVANGQYIGDLEAQLAILRQIAEASGDQGLLRQADDMAQVAAETRNASTEVADFETELRSVRIDALRDGFSQFLQDIAKGADNAKEALLNMLDSVLSRINQVIADRLSDKLIGALFGDGKLPGAPQGALGGLVGKAGAGAAAEQATGAAAATALQTGATTAAAALTTGGATAGASLTTGAVTASTSLVTAITTAAAGFTSAVVAAGAAFAAAVAAGSAAQAAGGLGSAFGGAGAGGGFAAGDFLPALPGGRVIRVAEGGHDEAVLTTDPRYASRQMAILREYLKQTRGLFGRIKIPEFAEGGWASAQDVEANLLRSLSVNRLGVPAPSSDMQLQSAATALNLRNINLFDRREVVSNYMRSAEGTRDVLNIVSSERDEIGRRMGIR